MNSLVRTIFVGVIACVASGAAVAQAQPPRSGATDGGSLAPRVERLEEQLVDLQGTVAAVETLAKSSGGGSPGYSSAGSGASGEQIRQLSEQIAELTQRLERLEARGGGGGVSGAGSQSQTSLRGSDYGSAPAGGFEDKQQLPPLGNQLSQQDRPTPRQPSASTQTPPFGTAVEPRPAPQPRPQNPFGDSTAAVQPASPRPSSGSAAGSSSGSARSLYEQGLSSFNRREYSASQTYFEQFLQQFPSDPLAGTAQYWLGEAAFISGEYKSAADRFLKTFTNYPSSDKAPEALLKLAISLRRLGENNAACDSFAELQRRFPSAPESITKRAETERRRANCA